jgi:DHA3 family macrolide efflux protein-like MFS transporter
MKSIRLYTNFVILWQSQLVSTLGDSVYKIALGFWILEKTGSTTIMGILMAVSVLPSLVISPFAGVIIDKYNRKFILILMDITRGGCIVFIAIAAINNFITVWMVFMAELLLGICGAIFNPGVESLIPDLVPKTNLTKANSFYSMATSGSNVIGSAVGGFLFQQLGSSLLFLFNGLSFLFSGISLIFINVVNTRDYVNLSFKEEMKDGFQYIRNYKGLRYLLTMAAILNFFSSIAYVLFLPLFQKTSSLGSAKYGIAMACFMSGTLIGYLLFSIISIPYNYRLKVFVSSIAIATLSIALAVNQKMFILILIPITVGGFSNAILNIVLMYLVQVSTLQGMRGKVLSFMNMICQGLTPLAMGLGGILANYIPIRNIISLAYVAEFVSIVPFFFVKGFSKFINHNYECDSSTNDLES